MSKIQQALQNKKSFIAFLTAGDPNLKCTKEYILELEKAGADLIEIGIPFSDPIAEGSVIQAANVRALEKGCTTDDVFEMVREVRKETNIPIVFLTYLNPVFKYGYDKFCRTCKACGVDGLIIPDMPYEEKGELLPFTKENDMDLITLIAPTSIERVAMLAKEATGYIYLVSSMGVTGTRNEITTDLSSLMEEIRKHTDVPVAVGFGIHKKEQVKEYNEIADGVIVGSAIIKIIAKHGEHAHDILANFVKEMIG